MTPIVDGHHHIWRQADLPWLMGPMQPRIFGPYEPIRRDYPIQEYLAESRDRTWSNRYTCRQTGRATLRGRGRLGAENRRGPAGPTPSSPMRISPRPTSARSSTNSRITVLCAACVCSSTGTTIRSTASPSAPDLAKDPGRSAQRRPPCRLRLQLRFAGLCATDGGRGRSRRSVPEGDVRAPARRHAGEPLAGRPGRMARGDGPACRLRKHRREALRALGPSSTATIPRNRRDHARDGRNIRRWSMPVRVELSD